MYYLYQHTKKTDGEVFYVGIGNKARASMTTSRSNFWKSVVEKHDFEVEILRSFKTWEEACEWEKFLISIYGRRDINSGILVNHTGGGDGCNNPSLELREKKRGKILEKIGKRYDVYRISDRAFMGTFNGTKDCAEFIGCKQQYIGIISNQNSVSSKGFYICPEGNCPIWHVIDGRTGVNAKKLAAKMSAEKQRHKMVKKVCIYKPDGTLVASYDSGVDASRATGISPTRVYFAAKNNLEYKGYVWKYE